MSEPKNIGEVMEVLDEYVGIVAEEFRAMRKQISELEERLCELEQTS